MFIYGERETETETEHEQGRGRQRGRHRIGSRLQAPSCQHRARCGAGTHRLRDHDLSWSRLLNWLSHPGAPTRWIFLIKSDSFHHLEFWGNFKKNFFYHVYFETEYEWGRGREWGRHRIQSRLQAPSCQHRAQCEARTHWTARSWPEPKSDAQPTEPPSRPYFFN